MIYVRTLFLVVPALLESTTAPKYVNNDLRMIVFDAKGLIEPILRITMSTESEELTENSE